MKVIKFYPKDAANDPDAALEQAVGVYDQVFILGYDKDGELNARASLNLDQAEILWMLEWFKAKMLMGEYAE